jgi:hypothetical protein
MDRAVGVDEVSALVAEVARLRRRVERLERMGANHIVLAETTAPGNGEADTCRIYAVDSGAGKTRLMAVFNSGAAQQLAVEP